MKIKSTLFKTLKFLSKKNQTRMKKLYPFYTEGAKILKNTGFKKIKKISTSTWKYYTDGLVRFTLKATKEKQKYVIKFTRGFEKKSNNSINFQEHFQAIFEFVVPGYSIKNNVYKIQVFKYLKGTSLSSLKNNEIKQLYNQAIEILDQLNEHKTVHCDLVEGNLIITKKPLKMYLIDWDTCCSKELNIKSDKFPDYTTKIKKENLNIYDDAYSFYKIFEKFNYLNIEHIKSRIGRNIYKEFLN